METPQIPVKPWYKKKRYIIPIAAVGGLWALGSLGATTEPVAIPNTSYQAQEAPVSTQQEPIEAKTVPTSHESNLSNDNYYTNVDGNSIHSPTYSDSVPAGASAQCRDGTYSFSQHRQGTCSHHGGVASWL